MLCDHYKEDDAGCEQINRLTGVVFGIVDLRSHIGNGSTPCGQKAITLISRKVTSKAEIGDFQIVILVQKEVLWFEVTMADLVSVAELEPIHHLKEKVAGHWFTEFSRDGQEVEELPTLSQLEHNIIHTLSCLLLLVDVVISSRM